MTWQWKHLERPTWDEDKIRIIGGAEPGVFDLSWTAGEELPGDWWSAADEEAVLAFGWMDVGWGEAEILLAVDPAARARGLGGFVLEHLELEAAERGLNYVFNTVAATHPSRDEVHDWLGSRGYRGDSKETSLRKLVRRNDPAAPSAQPRPSAAAAVDLSGDPGEGSEEKGGYVDVDAHRY